VIDPIKEEDRGDIDIRDVCESGPSWFDCLMLPCVDVLAVIKRTDDLDGQSVNLFRNALEWEPCSRIYSGIMSGGNLEYLILRSKY
jgi:hypothetical protein